MIVKEYMKQEYYSAVQVFTDGSKEPESGKTAAVFIPTSKIKISKRVSNHVSVFTMELLSIIIALQWIEEVQPSSVMCTDSMASLNSLLSGKSEARQVYLELDN